MFFIWHFLLYRCLECKKWEYFIAPTRCKAGGIDETQSLCYNVAKEGKNEYVYKKCRQNKLKYY